MEIIQNGSNGIRMERKPSEDAKKQSDEAQSAFVRSASGARRENLLQQLNIALVLRSHQCGSVKQYNKMRRDVINTTDQTN